LISAGEKIFKPRIDYKNDIISKCGYPVFANGWKCWDFGRRTSGFTKLRPDKPVSPKGFIVAVNGYEFG